jgi:AcrR family transcriptional regulator
MDVENAWVRKKLETRQSIISTVFHLVNLHGVDGVTVEEIAHAAGVSRRTFFNYFTSKEEAIVGLDPVLVAEMCDVLRNRPSEEGPVEVLRSALIPTDDPELDSWVLRNELISRYPVLIPRHLAAVAEFELALTRAMADRLGFDPERDPRARMLVTIVLGAVRTGIYWWDESDRSRSLRSVVDEAFEIVAGIRLTNDDLSHPQSAIRVA